MRPSPSQVEIEVIVHGETQVLQETVPKGFPRRLIPILADFMRLGFEACRARLEYKEAPSFAEFAPSLRGRPIDSKVEELGRKADKLKKQGRTYGQIARNICPDKQESQHKCAKKCADRIRQAHRSYVNREELRKLTSFDNARLREK